jgi:Na+/proline symporter
MRQNSTIMRPALFGPLFSGILGITLLLPASFFMLAMLIRICFGSTTLYYSMAPSFLQSPFDLFALSKAGQVCRQIGAQFIFACLLLAILLNLLAILRFRLQPGTKGWEVQVYYKRCWLNTAIAMQSGLLTILLVAYTLIQHIRY